MFENPKDDVRPGPLEHAWQRAAQHEMADEDDAGRARRRAAVLGQVAALDVGQRQARTATPAANRPHWLLVSGSAFALVLCAGVVWRLMGDPQADQPAMAGASMDGVQVAARAPQEKAQDSARQALPEAAPAPVQKPAPASRQDAPKAARQDRAAPAPTVVAAPPPSVQGTLEKAPPPAQAAAKADARTAPEPARTARAERAQERTAELMAAATPPPPPPTVAAPAAPMPGLGAAAGAGIGSAADRADTRVATRAAAKSASPADSAEPAASRRDAQPPPVAAAAATPLSRLARPAAPQAFPEPPWVDLIRRNDRAGLRAALDAGLNVDAADAAGRTPLMQAALHARPEIMADLLARSASRRVVDQLGNTVATYAAQSPDPRVRAALNERPQPGKED